MTYQEILDGILSSYMDQAKVAEQTLQRELIPEGWSFIQAPGKQDAGQSRITLATSLQGLGATVPIRTMVWPTDIQIPPDPKALAWGMTLETKEDGAPAAMGPTLRVIPNNTNFRAFPERLPEGLPENFLEAVAKRLSKSQDGATRKRLLAWRCYSAGARLVVSHSGGAGFDRQRKLVSLQDGSFPGSGYLAAFLLLKMGQRASQAVPGIPQALQRHPRSDQRPVRPRNGLRALRGGLDG